MTWKSRRRRHRQPWDWHSVFGFHRPWLVRQRWESNLVVGYLHTCICSTTAMEHAEHVELHAERRVRDLIGTSLMQRFAVVKSLIPKKSGCGGTLVVLENGCIANNKSEEARGFAGHFSAAFGSCLEPVVHLAERARLGLSAGIAKARGIVNDALIVPAELDLRRTFVRMNLARTIGEA